MFPMSTKKIIFVLLWLLKLSHAANFLCGSPMTLPKRWDCIVEDHPKVKTCKDVFFELASMRFSNEYSNMMIEQHQETCCAISEPEEGKCINPNVEDEDTTNIGGEKNVGDEPVCHICGSLEEFPGKPNTYISARYVGTYSCRQLYSRGKSQLIPGFMCGPLQDYAYEVCGCGEYHPKFGTPLPTPSPTTPNPTPDPTPSSTSGSTNAKVINTTTPVPTSNPHPKTTAPTANPTPVAANDIVYCLNITTKDECKVNKEVCKWKKDTCIDKKKNK